MRVWGIRHLRYVWHQFVFARALTLYPGPSPIDWNRWQEEIQLIKQGKA